MTDYSEAEITSLESCFPGVTVYLYIVPVKTGLHTICHASTSLQCLSFFLSGDGKNYLVAT